MLREGNAARVCAEDFALGNEPRLRERQERAETSCRLEDGAWRVRYQRPAPKLLTAVAKSRCSTGWAVMTSVLMRGGKTTSVAVQSCKVKAHEMMLSWMPDAVAKSRVWSSCPRLRSRSTLVPPHATTGQPHVSGEWSGKRVVPAGGVTDALERREGGG